MCDPEPTWLEDIERRLEARIAAGQSGAELGTEAPPRSARTPTVCSLSSRRTWDRSIARTRELFEEGLRRFDAGDFEGASLAAGEANRITGALALLSRTAKGAIQ